MTFTGLSAAARVAVWSVAALATVYWAALVSPLGRALDHSAMTALSAAPQEDRWAVSLVDLVSMDLFLALAGALVLIALAMHGVQRAVVAAVTIGGSALTAEWMKAHVERLDGVPNSFPSGHVMAVAALSAGLFLVAEGLSRSLALTAGAFATTVTGIAVVQLQWHRPSDVLASALIATCFAATALALEHAIRAELPGRDCSHFDCASTPRVPP